MRRVVVTGIGCVSPAGTAAGAMDEAIDRGSALGAEASIESIHGRTVAMRLARIPDFPRSEFLPARSLRRMGEASRIWTIACLLARTDAGLDGAGALAPTPDRRGTFLGTGFGCIDTTWDYLKGMIEDGPGVANPFLFSESVASAPAGHSAIELDTQGASVTLTCGDSSALTAIDFAARAIREGRIDLAYCGGLELLSPQLLRVLAAIASPAFVGEGAACLVLESSEAAARRGARIHASIAGSGIASDPGASPSGWSTDPVPLAAAIRRAVDRAREAVVEASVSTVTLHAPGSPGADAMEREAVDETFPEARRVIPSAVFGAYTAAGGLGVAAAARAAGRSAAGGLTLVNGFSWGGSCHCLALAGPKVNHLPRPR